MGRRLGRGRGESFRWKRILELTVLAIRTTIRHYWPGKLWHGEHQGPAVLCRLLRRRDAGELQLPGNQARRDVRD